MSTPRLLLHLEGLAVALAGMWWYGQLGGSVLLFLLLILAPDASMIGYLRNPRWGSVVYNAAHTYIVPLALIAFGYWQAAPTLQLIGVIWVTHIGFDRSVGFGLKYTDEFKNTHFQKV